jgi:hypothetical protein
MGRNRRNSEANQIDVQIKEVANNLKYVVFFIKKHLGNFKAQFTNFESEFEYLLQLGRSNFGRLNEQLD